MSSHTGVLPLLLCHMQCSALLDCTQQLRSESQHACHHRCSAYKMCQQSAGLPTPEHTRVFMHSLNPKILEMRRTAGSEILPKALPRFSCRSMAEPSLAIWPPKGAS